MEDYLIGIGKRIKEIRKRKNLTINTVAADAEVSNGLISRIENGRTISSLPVLLNIIQYITKERLSRELACLIIFFNLASKDLI